MNRKTLIYEVQDLKKVYNKRNALQIGRLQIHKGTIYGIVGPVGSGKTSLLKQLSGLEKQTEGKLLYDGQEFNISFLGKVKSPDEIKFLTLTGSRKKESVSLYFSSNYGKRSVEIRKHYFNKGFRRFMWDAVESDPRVLIIDNYGSMLDEELEQEISSRLRRMNRNLGTTIILSATNSARIQKLVSVMIFLDKGHIAKIRSGSQNKGPQRKQGYQQQRRRRYRN